MSAYEQAQAALKAAPKSWLVTGVAGFIGSNLLETLLKIEQRVVGLDNFSSGYRKNLQEVQERVSLAQWARFRLVEGDVSDVSVCQGAAAGVDFVVHQAALGSVPGSLAEPLGAHRSNVTGFLNVLSAARDAKARRLVYASSSAVYGDDSQLPKVEEKIGRALSPYAATKQMDEVYADVFARAYGFASVGLRYFNVFGPRQDPNGAYAAVIPKWIAALLKREAVYINGDGETTRDFCYIDNVVQANLLAATVPLNGSAHEVFNVALGERTTLNELFGILDRAVRRRDSKLPEQKPVYREFRPGDVRHSQADISKAQRLLGFQPTCRIEEGLELAMEWYRKLCRGHGA
ncbi:MAG TPA: SDR family oxidoreductase [Verrucomicrobiae bacterium]|nr:SDR family oxidoreductase [Verrucomicrobiae bacterium]